MFTVIMPIKPWDGAKSRLHAEADARRALARAFAQDALDAVLRTPEVSRVVVVSGSEEVREYALRIGATPIAEPESAGSDPLGTAVNLGAAWAIKNHPDDALAIIPSDLPALTSSELSSLLCEAVTHPRAFVPDTSGEGTTVLTSQRPDLLRPSYGLGSAERHRSYGAVELLAPAALRRDVDEFHELLEAQTLGVGAHTTAALTKVSTRASA
ncbi:2-phospho-L-lactate guanylyltransferase [Aeromicrobium panaciterrae]|uniref:Phosphoenolpyruvate guanylyltransferase n=1 Tax=Aeromicrobium panaciterrae TaxID=363861 RepID=A0ABU1ULG9_9ACTN|nr:2-phospho-L-lactate guanylyltransferase [Aeromicrobium panaciterrae]MDR7086043.1 2-phospho-L-lactate guanylyltransferase [Aeromicrobium panaciterrae]